MPSFDQKKSSISVNNFQSYFDNLNPIAELIAKDIKDAKENYGQLWHSLSINEQNDIINETLIQPEISLRYFDSFSVSPETNSRSSMSKSASDDSLTAVVLKNINYATPAATKDKPEKSEAKKDQKSSSKKYKSSSHTNIKDYYSFDGRNLNTYAAQKVALKFVQDDVIGTYRDEHSMPFSYKTQSQINLHLFSNLLRSDVAAASTVSSKVAESKASESESNVKHDRALIENFVKLQKELKMNLQKDQNKAKSIPPPGDRPGHSNGSSRKSSIATPNATSKVKSRPQVKPPPAPQVKPATAPQATTKKPPVVDNRQLEDKQNDNQDTRKISRVGEAKAVTSSGTSTLYATYADTYFENNENANLMMHAGLDAGHYAASSSSAVTSDEDDDKTICEEVKLLSNSKGFDFLNNW